MKNAKIVVELLVRRDTDVSIETELRDLLVLVAGGEYPLVHQRLHQIFWDVYKGKQKSQTSLIAFYNRVVPAVLAAYPESIELSLQGRISEILRLSPTGVSDMYQIMGLVQGCALGILTSFAPYPEFKTSAKVTYLNTLSVIVRGKVLRKLLSREGVTELPTELSGHFANLAPRVVKTLSWAEGNLEGQVHEGGSGVLDSFTTVMLGSLEEQELSPFGRQVYVELLKALFAESTFGERVKMLVTMLPSSK